MRYKQAKLKTIISNINITLQFESAFEGKRGGEKGVGRIGGRVELAIERD